MKTEQVNNKEERMVSRIAGGADYQEGIHYINGCKHMWNPSATMPEGKVTTFDEIEVVLHCSKCDCWYEVTGIVAPLHWYPEEEE